MKTPIASISGTALIIDDQEEILSVANDMLTAKGMNVLIAQGGLAGIQLFQTHHEQIDLVLLDMKMPDMDGNEVFVELQAIDPEVRVIIATGFDERETMAYFPNNQEITFIQKPYRFRVLIEMIGSVLARQQ